MTQSSLMFSFMRNLPFPTLYPENKTPVTYDVLEAGWIVAFCSVALSVYLLLPAHKEKFRLFFRATMALFLGLVIMLCNFGHEWEVGHLHTPTPYKAGSASEIDADIGLRFGLRAVNITLKAPSPKEGDLRGESINYNEQFSWTWAQGRAGFGPMAGRVQREFREHQRRGTPLPILWIAEYLTFDGEGIRFGRHYRVAGWYAHMCMWSALPAWLLCIILFNMGVVTYGASMLTLTGACLFTAAILWATIRNPLELVVPFDPPTRVLTTHFGPHWYLALVVGVLCMVVGLTVWALAFFHQDWLFVKLGIDINAHGETEYTTGIEGVVNPASDEQADIEMGPVSRPLKMTLTMRFRGKGTSKRVMKERRISIEESQPPVALESSRMPGPPVQQHRQDDPPQDMAPAPPRPGHHPQHPNPAIEVTQHRDEPELQPIYENLKQEEDESFGPPPIPGRQR